MGDRVRSGLVVGGALAQDLLADDRHADDQTKEVDHPLGARQAA
jgi:hypothetical protein